MSSERAAASIAASPGNKGTTTTHCVKLKHLQQLTTIMQTEAAKHQSTQNLLSWHDSGRNCSSETMSFSFVVIWYHFLFNLFFPRSSVVIECLPRIDHSSAFFLSHLEFVACISCTWNYTQLLSFRSSLVNPITSMIELRLLSSPSIWDPLLGHMGHGGSSKLNSLEKNITQNMIGASSNQIIHIKQGEGINQI